MSVYIMRIKLAQQTHTQLAHAHSLNMQALFYVHVLVCVHASVYVVSSHKQAAEIYGLHSG